MQSDISDKLDVEMDQKRRFRIVRAMSALPPKADIDRCPYHVRFVPLTDITPIIRSPRPQLHAELVGLQAQVLWRF